MKTEHTLGPWLYHKMAHDGFPGPSIQSAYGLIVRMPVPRDSEGDANARLIAAAPDLLAALTELVDALALDTLADGGEQIESAYREHFADARKAIAKAKGE
jgi:hypothetical protein